VIVVDASVLTEVLLQTPAAAPAEARFRRERRLHAPHLIDAEVTSALRRLVAAGHISQTLGRTAIINLEQFPLRRHPLQRLLPRIWELKDNLTPYDACYVALAEALGGVLLTRDAHIAAAAGLRAPVDVI
jgi:predicted nucleic acid-binding protein